MSRIIAYRAAAGFPVGSANTVSYCNARTRLPTGVLHMLAKRTAQQLQDSLPQAWKWHGRSVFIVDGSHGNGRCLLVVDQFEEVYTRATAEEGTRFQEALRAWAAAPEHVLLVTVRSDFYPDLQGSPAIFPLFQANHRDVLPLGKVALREAIVGPATQAGMYVDPAPVERLLADAAGEPCVLPHLQESRVAPMSHCYVLPPQCPAGQLRML